jgi:hypothetical protein
MLQVFNGDSLDSLQSLSGIGDQIYFTAVSNETYQIRFDAIGMVTVPVNLTFIESPPNDYFTNATVVQGSDITLYGTGSGASAETKDPAHGGNTVWYSWTAPENGYFTVGVSGASASVSAYTGADISSLVPGGVNNQSDSVIINAQSNQTYYLEVATPFLWEPDYPGAGGFQLFLFPGGTPANDNFVNAQLVVGTNTEFLGTNWGATLEPNDPSISVWDTLRRTIWYEWQAPASGLLQLTDLGSTVTPVNGIYLGTNLDQLGMIGMWQAPVRSNEVIHILIDGQYGDGGIFDIGLSFTPAPPNDDIENATAITGTSVTLTANVVTATGDSQNPSDRMTYQYRDVWWLWAPPGAGQVVITTAQPSGSPTFQVFIGTPTNLQLVAYDAFGGPSLQFDAVAGTNYYIRGTWGVGADTLDLVLNETLDTPALALAPQPVKSSVISTGAVQISGPRMLGANSFGYQISGQSGSPFQIEFSTDLVHWQPLQSGTLTNTSQNFIDMNPTGPARFYRVLAP